jgi:hypothetical protein
MLFLISDGSYTSKGNVIDIQKCVIIEADNKDDLTITYAVMALVTKHGFDIDEIVINPIGPPCDNVLPSCRICQSEKPSAKPSANDYECPQCGWVDVLDGGLCYNCGL